MLQDISGAKNCEELCVHEVVLLNLLRVCFKEELGPQGAHLFRPCVAYCKLQGCGVCVCVCVCCSVSNVHFSARPWLAVG